MSHTPRALVFLVCMGSLAGCGPKPEAQRAVAPSPAVVRPVAQGVIAQSPQPIKAARPQQEFIFVRECLAVGLRPTILLEIERKALEEARGGAQAGGPNKSQLQDLRENFASSAAKLSELAASPEAGRLAKVPQLMAEARAKQAANCSRLPNDLLHEEAVGLMMLEFIKITAMAPNQQEADRRAGEHFKQNWPSLINLPIQQKAALDEILATEREIHQLAERIDKETEFKLTQRQAVEQVYRELESRAKKVATNMTSEQFYSTLLGVSFPQRPWTIEKDELVALTIKEQKIVGHCIVSRIRLDLRGKRTGQTASLNLSVVHKTYADGHVARLEIIER